MKLRNKFLLALAGCAALAGVALAQVPGLFLTTLTGTEQIAVIVPSTGTVTTSPQNVAVTTATLGKYVASVTGGVNAQTGTSYTVLASDLGKLITFNSGSAVAVTLPQAGSTGFPANSQFEVENLGAGAVTITPTTSTINGSATLVVNRNRGAAIINDGTNYQIAANAAGLLITPATVAEGGSGAATFTAHGVLLGEGASAFVPTAVGTTGQLLQGASAADPAWATTLTGAYTFSGSNTFTNALNQFGSASGVPSHIATGQTTAPALTSCGGGSPAITGTDTAGIVTLGTTTTGCVITFNVAYTGTPFCVVSWIATPLASQSYVTSNVAITLTQTSASSNKVQYICVAPSGG